MKLQKREKPKDLVIIEKKAIEYIGMINHIIINSTLPVDLNYTSYIKYQDSRYIDARLIRQVSMYIYSKKTKEINASIGSYFGKDHATVLNAKKIVGNLIDTDSKFDRYVKMIEKSIQVNNFNKILRSFLQKLRPILTNEQWKDVKNIIKQI